MKCSPVEFGELATLAGALNQMVGSVLNVMIRAFDITCFKRFSGSDDRIRAVRNMNQGPDVGAKYEQNVKKRPVCRQI